MYSKIYVLKEVKEKNKHNPNIAYVVGRAFMFAYLNVGERGVMIYDNSDTPLEDILHNSSLYNYEMVNRYRRYFTSVVQNITYQENQVIVDTKNSTYIFELM